MKRFCWLFLLLFPSICHAHPHPPEGTALPKIVTAFPNGTGRIEICTTVFETPAGFSIPVNGVPTSFCHMWVTCIQLLEMPMPGMATETIGSIDFQDCGNAFLALGPTQCLDGNPLNDSDLNAWVVPEWEPGVGSIKFSIPRPLGRGIFDNNILSLVFFTNAEPAPGNITLTGVQCNGTCHAVSVTVPALVPCGPTCGAPGTPNPPGGPKPPTPTAGAPCPHAFNVAQVAPATVLPLAGFVPGKSTAIPGVLCLATSDDHLLNVNAFTDPACCASPVVQAVRLTKVEAAARKCPSTFPGYTVVQVGRERIRTWWPLNYTPPGTTFTLEVIGICNAPAAAGASVSQGGRFGSRSPSSPAQQLPGAPSSMNQTWTWTVVADPMTFRLLIDLEHTQAIGMSEVPCIPDERVYRALVTCADRIRDAMAALATVRNSSTIAAAQDSIFACEAVLFSAGMLFDHFPAFSEPPSNFLPAGMGIIDTIESPCLCKLVSDVDFIFVRAGLDGGV